MMGGTGRRQRRKVSGVPGLRRYGDHETSVACARRSSPEPELVHPISLQLILCDDVPDGGPGATTRQEPRPEPDHSAGERAVQGRSPQHRRNTFTWSSTPSGRGATAPAAPPVAPSASVRPIIRTALSSERRKAPARSLLLAARSRIQFFSSSVIGRGSSRLELSIDCERVSRPARALGYSPRGDWRAQAGLGVAPEGTSADQRCTVDMSG